MSGRTSRTIASCSGGGEEVQRRRSSIPPTAPLAIGKQLLQLAVRRGGPPVPGLRDPSPPPTQADRTNAALSSLKFLRDLADWTGATMPAQHKSFVFFSQGVGGLGDADPDTLFLNANGSRIIDAMANVVAAATRANTSIFSIDPRGLATVAANGARPISTMRRRGSHKPPGAR